MRTEAAEILRAADRVGPELTRAAHAVHECSGRVVVVGLGKSGHVGRKISATLASLGTPSFFLHAAEASHGDLGMVRREDVGLFISNSGTSMEIVALLPHFRRLGAMMIAITGGLESPLAQHADIVLNSRVEKEGDPLQLAPMSSTTLQLALGDALAAMVTLLRGLKREDFALFHPGGALGRRLLTRVRDVMGYHHLVVDMTALVTMRNLGYPVMFDATHSVQRPGGMGGMSGGDSALALPLARAAAAVGIDVLFAETHPDPKKARSDGPNMIPLNEMGAFLDQVLAIHRARRALPDGLRQGEDAPERGREGGGAR